MYILLSLFVSNSIELFEIIRLLLQATAFVGLKHYVTVIVNEGGRGGFKIIETSLKV